jgi:cation diffusion facilitator family transporter
MAESSGAVWTAFAADVGVALTKFVAAAASGSSSLLAEGLHSTADAMNQLVVLLGKRLAKKPPDPTHPFGHGKELYFWTLVVAVSIFSVGGLASIAEGVVHIVHPSGLTRPTWNYVTLAIAFCFDGYALVTAYRQFVKEKPERRSMAEEFKQAKDPTTFLVLCEDSAAIVGVLIAAAAVFLSHHYHLGWIDGAGAVLVGLVLIGVALVLIQEIRLLLIGERADPELIDDVRHLVEADPAVSFAHPPLTTHFGPDTVLLTMNADFKEKAEELPPVIRRLHARIQEKHPAVRYIYIQPTPRPAS